MIKLLIFKANTKATVINLKMLLTIKVISKRVIFNYKRFIFYKNHWVYSLYTKATLKTGASTLITGVHQHSNWVTNKAQNKAKKANWIVITDNKNLPYLLYRCIICTKTQTLKIFPEFSSDNNAFKLNRHNKAANTIRQNEFKLKRACLYKVLAFNYLKQKRLLISVSNWVKEISALAYWKNVYTTLTLFPQLSGPL
ncbi:MAG: hypothetical protein AAJB65_00315 [Candidatus Hodgkinia cicadicola]